MEGCGLNKAAALYCFPRDALLPAKEQSRRAAEALSVC